MMALTNPNKSMFSSKETIAPGMRFTPFTDSEAGVWGGHAPIYNLGFWVWFARGFEVNLIIH